MSTARIGTLAAQSGRTYTVVVPGNSDPYTDSIAAGRCSAESLRTLELLVQPEDRVLDVGANVGEYSLVLSGLAAGVHAVEASPVNAAFLRANLLLNNITNCDILEMAVVGLFGPRTVCLEGASAYATVMADTDDGPGIDTVALASLLLDFRPSVLKVDIEGYEEHVRYSLCDFVCDTPSNVLVVEINLGERFRAGAARVVEALRTTGRNLWCLYPELPPTRCAPLLTDLPERTVSDLLITGRELPPTFDLSPLTEDERSLLYVGP